MAIFGMTSWRRFILQCGVCLACAVLVAESILSTASMSVIRGNSISLPCQAYQLIANRIIPSTISIEWHKDSIPLVESTGPTTDGHIRLDATRSYQLTITVATTADAGLYTCRAEGDPIDPTGTSTPIVAETTQASLTVTAASRLSEESNVTLTVEEPSPPGDPMNRETKNTSIDITWNPTNGPVLSYEVLYRKGAATGAPDSTAMRFAISPPLETSLLVQGLEVFTEYSFWVEASYVGSYTKQSGVAVLRTGPGTPTTAPTGVIAMATSSSVIDVRFTAPPLDSLNGELFGYEVILTPQQGVPTRVMSGGSSLSKEVMNLLPYTNYTIKVAAVNTGMGEAAVGPYSNEVVVQTMEDVPGIPKGLKVVGRSEDSITIFWFPPDRLNSESATYNVDFRKGGSSVWNRVLTSTLLMYHTRTMLDIYTMYEFQVTAENSIGEGQSTPVLKAYTDVAAPSPPVNVTVTDIGMGRARVSWMKPEVFYKSVDSYTVTYWESGKNVTMEAVEVDKLWRILENLQGGVQYVVKVQAATTSLSLSDSSSQPSSRVKQGEASEWVFFTIEKQVGNTTEAPGTTNAPNSTVASQPSGSHTGTIVGVVFAMAYVLALLIVGLSFLFIRMRKKDRLDFEKQENGVPPAFAKPDELEEPPIPVSKFEAHVAANHADSDGGFATEYEDIQHVSTSYPALSSTDPNLKYKNRYTNIVAYDHTRVKLSVLPNQPLSDYINANYIDGYGRQKAYIAAQGPLKSTFEDFWRMVWEQHTMVIVMITKLEERGRIDAACELMKQSCM